MNKWTVSLIAWIVAYPLMFVYTDLLRNRLVIIAWLFVLVGIIVLGMMGPAPWSFRL